MKKILKILILLILIISIIFCVYLFMNKKNKQEENYSELKKYISNIYGKTFIIPEFDDINDADESWLWENINQYLWNNDEAYNGKNLKAYGYTYEEISEIAKIIYGNNLKKDFPTGSQYMRYDKFNDKYGPTSYGLENYYDYVIDNIEKNGNTYTISIYDFTVSLYRTLGENPDNLIDIYTNLEYSLNSDNGQPLLSIKSLNDKEFQNILNKKNKLSHKLLTITYDEKTKNYHITSCKYLDTKPEETLALYYKKMQASFEIINIDYDYDDVYTQSEMEVKNFEDLSSIYTENALETYKSEMDLFNFKPDGSVYISAGDINIADYIFKIEIKNAKETKNKISCEIIRTFRKSFNPDDENYNETYSVTDTFSIVKQNDSSWLIDEFNYNNLEQ